MTLQRMFLGRGDQLRILKKTLTRLRQKPLTSILEAGTSRTTSPILRCFRWFWRPMAPSKRALPLLLELAKSSLQLAILNLAVCQPQHLSGSILLIPSLYRAPALVPVKVPPNPRLPLEDAETTSVTSTTARCTSSSGAWKRSWPSPWVC